MPKWNTDTFVLGCLAAAAVIAVNGKLKRRAVETGGSYEGLENLL